MKIKMRSLIKYAGLFLMMLSVAMFSACSGGGGSAAPPAPVSGTVVQGPVAGALVCADHNDGSTLANGVCDPGEVTTTSDAEGNFTYNPGPGYAYISRSTGGTDTTTGKPALPMAAPQGVTTISPITTMVALTPAAEQAALIVKLETIMGGASYASNPSVVTTPAALALTQAIEASMTAVGGAAQQSATSGGGTALPQTQVNQMMTVVATNIATELAKPTTTTATLTSSTGIAGVMETGCKNAATTISNTANTNVVFSDTTIIAAAVKEAVTTVTTAISTQTGSAGGSLKSDAASAVPEAEVTQPISKEIETATNNATNTSSQSVAAVVQVAGDTTRPTVTAVSPAENAVAVSQSTSVAISFSKKMNPNTITGSSFFLKGPGGATVPAVIGYNSDSNSSIMTLTVAGGLAGSTAYTATFSKDCQDLSAKLGLAADKVWSFTTIAAPDMTPPTATVSPADGATGQAVATKIVATFSRAIDKTTLTTANFSVIPNLVGATPVSGIVQVKAGNMEATFIPALPLAYNTTYNVTLGAGIKSVEGAAKVSTTTTFTTVAPPDITQPKVTSLVTSPAAVGGVVPVSAVVVATFDKALDVTTLNATNFTLKQGTTAVPGSVQWNSVSKTATFKPTSNLTVDKSYTATVTTAIRDTVGNFLDKEYTLAFSTAVKPTVAARSPEPGATGVAVNTKVEATFDKAMDPATITTTSFNLKQGTTAVSGSVSLSSDGKKASFTPTSNLSNGLVYTATVTTACKDAAGNALDQTYTWSFTTVVTGATGTTGAGGGSGF